MVQIFVRFFFELNSLVDCTGEVLLIILREIVVLRVVSLVIFY